jgi:hypothetical protein
MPYFYSYRAIEVGDARVAGRGTRADRGLLVDDEDRSSDRERYKSPEESVRNLYDAALASSYGTWRHAANSPGRGSPRGENNFRTPIFSSNPLNHSRSAAASHLPPNLSSQSATG